MSAYITYDQLKQLHKLGYEARETETGVWMIVKDGCVIARAEQEDNAWQLAIDNDHIVLDPVPDLRAQLKALGNPYTLKHALLGHLYGCKYCAAVDDSTFGFKHADDCTWDAVERALEIAIAKVLK